MTKAKNSVESVGTDAAVPEAEGQDDLLTLKLSQSLIGKLKHSAQEEGIDIGALVAELLAEGITLRAWEIIERKSAMRGNGAGNGNHQHAAPPFNSSRHGGNMRHGGGRPPPDVARATRQRTRPRAAAGELPPPSPPNRPERTFRYVCRSRAARESPHGGALRTSSRRLHQTG